MTLETYLWIHGICIAANLVLLGAHMVADFNWYPDLGSDYAGEFFTGALLAPLWTLLTIGWLIGAIVKGGPNDRLP